MFIWILGFSLWTVAADVATAVAVLVVLLSFVRIREFQVGVVVKMFSPASLCRKAALLLSMARPLPGAHPRPWYSLSVLAVAVPCGEARDDRD
ncbi:MAG: hypothetical protein IT162_04565 [Bryobacterales bacterium]|nr:hypothetical protein [Bryobacterales bacterium]